MNVLSYVSPRRRNMLIANWVRRRIAAAGRSRPQPVFSPSSQRGQQRYGRPSWRGAGSTGMLGGLQVLRTG
jgi:hypothetical protein